MEFVLSIVAIVLSVVSVYNARQAWRHADESMKNAHGRKGCGMCKRDGL